MLYSNFKKIIARRKQAEQNGRNLMALKEQRRGRLVILDTADVFPFFFFFLPYLRSFRLCWPNLVDLGLSQTFWLEAQCS
jgi:hypothetical protein